MGDSYSPRKTVFLSSVALGLDEYRDAAYRAIEGLDGYHCDRMEDFGARDAPPIEVCLKRVRSADIFVGLVGQRYGSCPPGSETSYTEAEYGAAEEAGMPTLMFVASETFLVPAHLIESDEMRKRLGAFREHVLSRPTTKFFDSPAELGVFVSQSIHNHEKTVAGQGDQRETNQNQRTYLLFPFAVCSGGYDTGISIANTGKDPWGTASTAGACTVFYYGVRPEGAPAPPPQSSFSVAPGQTLTYVLSSGGGRIGAEPNGLDNRGAGFQGYVIVECGFAHAHGFAALSRLGGGPISPGPSWSYLAERIKPSREDG